ncbi:fused MFS/spermidine synthase [Azospirillum canadense]|uniref:fused MFS/spermidine synthase n=1 Tax=Azospirillum canadense TaxID=403962 RepID=UPI002227D372|nr:fused MFS/spermidine synthase [Azospirillum canadense]MCW2235580.1 spermidine synthase [Azospirillum canadense]
MIQPEPPTSPTRAYALAAAAFAAGWSLMMMEILGGRLMAPHFGYSVYQWGAVIGVVMAFMAAGYWTGGQVGDGPKAVPALRFALLAGAVAAGLTPWLGRPMLADVAERMNPAEGSVFGAALVLGAPSFALAMVSPICAGLSALSGAAAAGRIYAVGTLGSIGGTFFAAFYAIPELGVSAGYALAAVLPALACAMVPGRWRMAAAAALAVPAAWAASIGEGQGFALYRETPHNTIMVREDAHEIRLHLNVLWATQSRLRKDGGPTGLYYDLFTATPALTNGRTGGTRVLVLGLAGGAVPRSILTVWPGADVLGVELDPAVVEVARERFGLDPRVRVAVEDARRHVETSTEQHDLIIVDLYSTAVIPFFTATREFFAAVERRLAPGGVVVMNVVSPQDRDALVGPLAATQGTVFPSVYVADAGRGNWLLIATKEKRTLDDLRVRLEHAPEAAAYAASQLLKTLAPAEAAGQPVLTDDRSDIDLRSLAALYGR